MTHTAKELRDMISSARSLAIQAVWDHIADRTVELKTNVRYSQTVDTDFTADYIVKHFNLNKIHVANVTSLDLMELESADLEECNWGEIPTDAILMVLEELEAGRFEDFEE